MSEIPGAAGASTSQAHQRCDMAGARISTYPSSETVHRKIRYRLFPNTFEVGSQLAGIAGGCRYVWDYMLDDCEEHHLAWKANSFGAGSAGTRLTTLHEV